MNEPNTSDSTVSAEQTVPYARFQQVVQARNELTTQLQAARDQAAALLGEKQEWANALGERDTALSRTRGELLRLRVAASKNIPLDLASRLVGETEQELAADADTLAQYLAASTAPTASGAAPARPAPGVPPASGSSPTPALDLNRMSPAEIRRARAEGRLQIGGSGREG